MRKALISSVGVVALLTLAACGDNEEAAQTPAETTTEEPAQTATQEDAVDESAAQEAAANAEQAAENAQTAAEEAAAAAAEALESASQAASEAVDNAAETATQMADDAGQAVQQTAEDAGMMAGDAGDALGNAASNLADAADEAAEGAGQALQNAAEGAGDALGGVAETAQNALAAAGLAGPLNDTSWASGDSDTALVAFNAGTISGNGGCNTFTGTYEAGEDGAFSVGPLAATKMACEAEIMTAETAFLAALQSAATYEVDGDTLVLADADGSTVLSLNRAAQN